MAKKTKKKRASAAAKKKTRKPTRKPKRVKRSVTVTVSDQHMRNVKDVAAKLRAKGMKVDSILEKTGQITGSYSKGPSSLKKVAGVLDAEEQPVFQIAPPGSEIQ